MSEYKKHRLSNILYIRDYIIGEKFTNLAISQTDRDNGSPKIGDKIVKDNMNNY